MFSGNSTSENAKSRGLTPASSLCKLFQIFPYGVIINIPVGAEQERINGFMIHITQCCFGFHLLQVNASIDVSGLFCGLLVLGFIWYIVYIVNSQD